MDSNQIKVLRHLVNKAETAGILFQKYGEELIYCMYKENLIHTPHIPNPLTNLTHSIPLTISKKGMNSLSEIKEKKRRPKSPRTAIIGAVVAIITIIISIIVNFDEIYGFLISLLGG